MLWVFHGDFAALGFRDPDDAMRLAQVRDWIAGQAWLDVSQHRVNPPIGGPMHWSRIVDLPIAALILLSRPFLSAPNAEILACALVPVLLLGGLTLAVYRAARLMDGPRTALVAVCLLLTAPSILVQFTPLRIDHHGWQIWMAAIALGGAFDPNPRRGGIVAGMALAVWLQISSEGLPYAALFGGLFALRQILARDHWPHFVAFAATLGAGALAMLVATRGWHAPFAVHCDALSAVYIWPLVAFAAATPLAGRLIGIRTTTRRLAVAAVSGLCAVATFAATGGPCLSGDPFAALGPLAYRYWYLQVMEGRPIWEQGWSMAGVILLPAIVGLTGTFLAARAQSNAARRLNWLSVALLLIGATLVSVLVMRAMTVAHMIALPGIAWMLAWLFQRVQSSSRAVLRIVGSVGLVMLTPAGLCALWVAAISPPPAKASVAKSADCRAAATLAPLRALPAATLFAPLDIGPDILVQTRHSVIGTAHHRNAAGITAVIEGFMAPPDTAHRVVAGLNGGKGADYVVTCTGLNEFTLYAKDRPNGLAGALARGKVPAWLQTVPTSGPLHIYKVLDQPGLKASATPFMQ
jgi:hypothetical protein